MEEEWSGVSSGVLGQVGAGAFALFLVCVQFYPNINPVMSVLE